MKEFEGILTVRIPGVFDRTFLLKSTSNILAWNSLKHCFVLSDDAFGKLYKAHCAHRLTRENLRGARIEVIRLSDLQYYDEVDEMNSRDEKAL